ncbi:hypothetical protein [Bradyrhizobium sp. AZCC 2289]|jgi:hypothetical protein|uniref:hypothetical protein n=1 Tax=Bradyrhizobium sp. AZCC 2289 TaxID=3117026 RepID=UPI002FF30C93
MANPLTLYVPIKQDPITQAEAKLAYANFVSSVQHGLDGSHIVHYARLALIPNPGGTGILAICLITTFDGPMNPYLKFFWNNGALQKVFSGLAAIALNPPNPPVTDLTGFENFINNNNLNNPNDLYNTYPQTVRQIQGAFPHPA